LLHMSRLKRPRNPRSGSSGIRSWPAESPGVYTRREVSVAARAGKSGVRCFGTRAPANSRPLGVDATRAPFPVGVAFRAHRHNERLTHVQAVVEQQEAGLRLARLEALCAETSRDGNHVERPAFTAAPRGPCVPQGE